MTPTERAAAHEALFAALPPDVRVELEHAFVREEHDAGTVMLREGDDADRYLLLDAGDVEIWTTRPSVEATVPRAGEPWEPDAHAHVLINRLGPGDGVGEMALVLGGQRRATVRAAGPVVARALDRAVFERLVASHPALFLALEAEVAIRGASLSLGESSPFAGASPELLRWLALRTTTVEVAAGDDVVRAGEPGDAFFVIRRGRVEVLGERADGTTYRIAELGPGDPFGEQALLSGGLRTATVRALEPVELLRLGREDFEYVLGQHAARAQYLFLLSRQRSRPRRREGVEATPAGADGLFILKDTRRFRYLRLSEPGLFLWNLMDGEHTVRDLSLAYFERYHRFGVDAVLQAIAELHVAGFVEVPEIDARIIRSVTKPNLMARAALRAAPWIRRTFALPDPDRLLTHLYRFAFRPLFRLPALLGLAAIALTGIVLFAWTVTGRHTGNAGAGGFALAGLLAVELQVVLHELGHALTTKHFGREVHSVGVGWYFFSPVAFVDTSDIWLEGRRRRIAVAAAGPCTNFVLAGAAACVLPFAGGEARSFLFALASAGYGLGLLNLNPLFELDGYYILSDWLDIANLRTKALAFIGARVWRNVPPTKDRRLARIYTWYGLAALAYALFTGALILVAYHRLVEHLVARALPVDVASALGWLFAALMVSLVLANLWQGLRRRAGSSRLAATT